MWARQQPSGRAFRFRWTPQGELEKLEFRHTGRRWDDEDGWELTFELLVLRP